MSDDEDRRNYSDEEGEDVGFDDSDRDDDSEEDEEDDEEEMKRVSASPSALLLTTGLFSCFTPPQPSDPVS